MSEPTIPDCCACGCSGETQQSRRSEWIYWTCGGWQHIESGKFGVNGKENRDTHMALIRSLREECDQLREERHKGLVAIARDAERDQIADWLEKSRFRRDYKSTIKAQLADRIRNNEHRSNT